MKRIPLLLTIGILMLALPLLVLAASSYDEAASGDLSGDGAAPTALTVSAGSNVITGTTGNTDRDYAAFSVPAGHQLTAINVNAYQSGSTQSFVAIAAGSQITSTTDASVLLGYKLFTAADVGTDIMPAMGMATTGANAAQGFTAPLPAGDYTFWVQEIAGDAGSTAYAFDLVIEEEMELAVGLDAVSAETTPTLQLALALFALLFVGTLTLRKRAD